jgi:hypothetical protein
LQNFTAIKTMADAFLPILSVSSSRHLFAAAGEDEKVRIYDMQQDFGGQTRVSSGGLWPVARGYSLYLDVFGPSFQWL